MLLSFFSLHKYDSASTFIRIYRFFIFQSISLETSILLAWYDNRINLDESADSSCIKDAELCYMLINRNATNDIWFPDIFVDKTKSLRNPVYQIPPASLKFYENHRLFYNQRINYDLSCPMQFDHYPVSIGLGNYMRCCIQILLRSTST